MRWTEEQYQEYTLRRPHIASQPVDADDGPESELQRKCEKWLRENGFPYHHDRSRGKNKAGWFDLVALLPEGRAVFIEFKAAKGKLRPEQQDLIRMAKYLKHEVHEVRSYKRFLYLVTNSPEAYEDGPG